VKAGFAALPLLLWALPLQLAYAARGAVVDVEAVELREGPGTSYKTVETLARGASVTASNQPTEGYYKVRAASGAIGFVQADTLVLEPMPDLSDTSLPDPVSASAATPGAEKKARRSAVLVRLKALGGYNFFSLSDVNTLLGADVIKYGYSAGGQFEFVISPALAAVVRAEYLFKNVSARDRVADKVYDISVSSVPVMAGFNITLGSAPTWSCYLGVLGGLAPPTQLSATSTSEAEPNVTASSAMAYAGMAKLEVDYSIGKHFSVFGEGGYRYLATAQLTPSVAGNGSSIFQSGGSDVPISISLSGPFVGLGAGIAF
jgi:opacity protein-like surface antigen